MLFAHYPILFGIHSLAAGPPPAPLLALYLVLPCAALLLDHAYAGWAHRHLDGRGPRDQLLPPGSGVRAWRKLHRTPLLLGVLAAVSVLVAVAAIRRRRSAHPVRVR